MEKNKIYLKICEIPQNSIEIPDKIFGKNDIHFARSDDKWIISIPLKYDLGKLDPGSNVYTYTKAYLFHKFEQEHEGAFKLMQKAADLIDPGISEKYSSFLTSVQNAIYTSKK